MAATTMRHRLMFIAGAATGFLLWKLVVDARFRLYVAHRYYHWKSGSGWRCEQCRYKTHVWPDNYHPRRAPRMPTNPMRRWG